MKNRPLRSVPDSGPSGKGGRAEARGWKNKIKWIGLTVAGVLLFLLLADVIAAVIQIHTWIEPEKQPWSTSPAEIGLDAYTFELETADGVVRGWKIAAQEPIPDDAEEWIYTTEYSDRTIVFAPNYDSNREISDLGGLSYISALCSAGYNVFTFDWTGSGYSDGTKNVFDLDKTEQLNAVIDYAKKESGASFLAVQGIGFGCYPAARAASENRSVDALILDSCYENFSDCVFGNYSLWADLPIAPVRETVRLLFPLFTGVNPEEASLTAPINALAGKHLMLIQGGSDEVFGTEGAAHLYQLASVDNRVELWTVDGCNHLRVYSYDPDTYVRRVSAFLSESAGDTPET